MQCIWATKPSKLRWLRSFPPCLQANLRPFCRQVKILRFDHRGRPVPEFSTLVKLLQKECLDRNPWASCSGIADTLAQRDKMVYKSTSSLSTQLEEKAGIVQPGGKEGDAWIFLLAVSQHSLSPWHLRIGLTRRVPL